MMLLDFSHSPLLVAFACLIALVAGFTGLSMTRDLSKKSDGQVKVSIALASIALGGGIWSMHFVAMLGLQLPVLFYYDAAITLASALLAILIVSLALILMHFTARTRGSILAAGALLGVGILVMHYVGMAGLRLCQAVYTLPGVALSSVVAVLACMLAMWVAYQRRNNRNIVLATLCFGIAVTSVHFLAMSGTAFVAVPSANDFGPAMSNEALAIGVIISSFVIFGGFMWVSTTYLSRAPVAAAAPVAAPAPAFAAGAELEPAPLAADPPLMLPEEPASPLAQMLQIPCEREGRKVFISPGEVAFVRADGHYTQVYTPKDRLFCAWPITEAMKRLEGVGFLQTHRSYLVNPEMVVRFEKAKDKGRCLFESSVLPPVPVSRSKLASIQDVILGEPGATGAS